MIGANRKEVEKAMNKQIDLKNTPKLYNKNGNITQYGGC